MFEWWLSKGILLRASRNDKPTCLNFGSDWQRGWPLPIMKYPLMTLTGATGWAGFCCFHCVAFVYFYGCMLCMVCQPWWLLSQCLYFLKKKYACITNMVFFCRRDRIVENMSLILLIPIHLRNIYSFSVNHVFLPV